MDKVHEIQIVYLPIGVPTFHLESANSAFKKSVELLKSIDPAVCVPDELLLGVDALTAFLKDKNPALVILQNATFANGAYATEALKRTNCPFVLWTLPEPVIDGGRLRLNSLTGAFSAGNALGAFKRPFEYVYGAPESAETARRLRAAVSAAKVLDALKNLNLLQVGHTPQGFGFGRALDGEIATKFGANLISIEARELIDIAKGYSDEEAESYLEKAEGAICGLDKINKKNALDFARLYKVYGEYCEKNNIGAVASRCWPDFFTSFGTPVCAALSLLNDMGIPCACEADAYGALSMYIGQKLSSKAVFFGDPVSLDREKNTITFWHCGAGACSLAREDTGARAGLHCNRKIGPTLEFGCKPSEHATVLRVGKDSDGKFRIFVAVGEALDEPQQFFGTSSVVRMNGNAYDIVTSSVKDGWEPHFAVAMEDISEEVSVLGNMLGIEVVTK